VVVVTPCQDASTLRAMVDRLLRELHELGQQAAEVQGIVAEIQGRMPTGATGTDAQGAVEVRVGPDGVPERVTAARDWSRRRRPEEIGAAVVEAAGAAASELMSAWSSELTASDWEARAARLEGESGPPPTTAEEDGTDPRYVFARPAGDLAEDVISALDHASDEPTPTDARATGSDRARRVSLTLGAGTVQACEVDATWARRQSAIGLNGAFEEALEDARAALRQADGSAAAAGQAQQLSSLFDETLAVLKDPGRLAGG
jgi:hypothetical protein